MHWAAHPFGLAGLGLSTLGAALLLKFQAPSTLYTPLGEQVMTWVNKATPENKRRYRLQVCGYRGALIAMALGFVLQAIDLLT